MKFELKIYNIYNRTLTFYLIVNTFYERVYALTREGTLLPRAARKHRGFVPDWILQDTILLLSIFQIIEDITTNRTTISPRTGAKQDTTQYETTQRAVRQTTTLGNTQKAGDKPLTWEPENYNQTFTQSNPQTVSPTQVFREMPLKSNHATVIVPTLATVSAIAILLLLVICFIVYKRYVG